MKIFLFVTILFNILFTESPTIKFDKKEYNFNKIKSNSEVVVQFNLTNTSRKIPLIIYSVSTTCGCTTASSPKMIKPMETKPIIIKFNSKGFKGYVSKDIVVITNTDNEYDKLTIRGEIVN